MTIRIKKLAIFICLTMAMFAAAHFALAATLDVGLDQAAGTGLSAADPRVVAANIIRIVLGFLGIIAVGLIIYAGWLWLTAGGNEENIERAKKILTQAVIGLIIILSAFAIASFILSKLIDATGGGSDGSICAPACSGASPYCCNSSCSSSPCSSIQPPGGDSFRISSTVPRNLDTGVIRNVEIKAFLNKNLANNTTQGILDSNFKVEKTDVVNPANGALTPVTPQPAIIAGAVTSGSNMISFKAGAACGNEKNTPNCLPEWSKFKVTVNGSATPITGLNGLFSVNGQPLSCGAGSICVFEFSTNNLIDTSGPRAGIVPTQICRDDGTDMKPGANTVTGWGRDDVGISGLNFYQQKQPVGPEELVNSPGAGNGQKYQSVEHTYVTTGMTVGDTYKLRVEAVDLAGQLASDDFSTTIRPGHCCNGIKDGTETDIDCGGTGIDRCGACEGAACAGDMSVPATCNNNICASQFCTPTLSNVTDCEKAGYAPGTSSCCLCRRLPVITGIFPVGGFCRNETANPPVNFNLACLADSDCTAPAKCDLDTPNGAVGNFTTIMGRNFGANAGKVYFKNGAAGGDWAEAKLANDLAAGGNDKCGNKVWTDSQIIAVVPAGAIAGPVKVETAAGFSDDSAANPILPNFVVNTVTRPGLCQLENNKCGNDANCKKDHGLLNDTINYYGVKLSGNQAYFGDWQGKISAIDSTVVSDKQITAQVPNIQTGRTTSFVANNKVFSNYLSFTKLAEPYTGPLISSFDPKEGAAGQYVTIHGSGFGASKGNSEVYFNKYVVGQNYTGGRQASYNFPRICADSIWSDKQIIVKAPAELAAFGDGLYSIIIKIAKGNGFWPDISANLLKPGQFTLDSTLPLAPSLCKINPSLGKVNSAVNLYGEYFGAQDTNSQVRFQLNKNQTIFDYWKPDDDPKITGIRPDKITTKVPDQAVTGPVKAVKGDPEVVGNGLNFKVGVCQKATQVADCGANSLCCSVGTPYAGQCKTGTVEQDICFPEIKSCVYEWDFGTLSIGRVGDPCDQDAATAKCEKDDTKCQSGLVCDPSACVCKQPCNNNLAGVCSPNNSKCLVTPSTPVCNATTCLCECTKDSDCKKYGETCNIATGVCIPPCTKNKDCKLGEICDLATNTCLPPEACSGYGNQCADSYFCPNSPGRCSTRPANNAADTGVKCGDEACRNLNICKDVDGKNLCSYINNGANKNLNNRCKKNEASCSLPRTIKDIENKEVTEKCGLVDNRNVWYYDSQQTCAGGFTKSLDRSKCLGAACQACSTGFSCQADGGAGICVTDTNICPAGSSCSNDKCTKIDSGGCECCCDIGQNTASGNPGCCSGLSCGGTCGADTNPSGPIPETTINLGQCTGCAAIGSSQEAHNNACNCNGTSGKFCDTSGAGGKGVCKDCAQLSTAQSCSGLGAGACCVDAKNNNACRSGTAPYASGAAGDTNNYCAYYNCGIGNQANQCKTDTPLKDGNYKTTDCGGKCVLPPVFGEECSKVVAKADQCAADVCPNFSCLDENGYGVGSPYNPPGYVPRTINKSCGTCCCNPRAATDQCKTIDSKLSCVKDKGSCSGANRGLCCGCSKDSECGDASASGCGSDTCCQARPRVIDDAEAPAPRVIPRPDNYPKPSGDRVCRNAIIQATFNQPMQINTFSGNVILAGFYDQGQCPAGTEYLTAVYKPTIFAKIKSWLAKVPVINKFLTVEAQADAPPGNYCAVLGSVSGYNTGANQTARTVMEFRPRKVLEANKRYYVIIKGDSDITDAINNGVLSQAGIGMKGAGYLGNPVTFNGLVFNNGKIWSFTTMVAQAENNGACLIDHAEIEPASYLFQTNKDNTGDNDATKDTFNKINDSDLVYRAVARAADGSILTPVDVYSWTWGWTLDSTNIFELLRINGLPNNGDKRLVRAQPTATEGKSVITARATMTTPDGGGPFSATANAYLMVCANPWPAVKTVGGNLIWQSWRDSDKNCNVPDAIANCQNTGFELYYCRDAGGPGTADDLPAILSDTAVIRGSSGNPSAPLGTSILKELYFFREDLPDVTGITLATTTNDEIKKGGKAGLTWSAIPEIKVPAGQTLDKYLVYYGTTSGKYTNSVDAGKATSKEISGLTNGRTYYFAVTAKYKSGAESAYSNETTAIPADSQPPKIPAGLWATAAESGVTINWAANTDDAVNYKVYYGAFKDSNDKIIYGASVDVSKSKCLANSCSVKISNLNLKATYYFSVTALDAQAPPNESEKAGEISFDMTKITNLDNCQANLQQINQAVIAKRLEANKVLLEVTQSNCSSCVCDPNQGGDPKSRACISAMTKTFEILGFSGLLRDPWGDPYLINENENEYNIGQGQELFCLKDSIYSLHCAPVSVPLYGERPLQCPNS